MATRADWDAQFGTGMRSSYDFTIYVATFGTDLAYNNGDTYLLILTGVDEDDQPSTEMLSLGAGWESLDGGFTVQHEKKAAVNQSSVYGKWCSFAADAFDAAGNNWIYDKNSLEASMWTGLKFHLDEQVVGEAFTDRKTGKEVAARTRLMPTAFLGFDSEDAVAASPAPEAPPATSPSTVAPTDAPVALLVVAKQSADFTTFVNAALQIAEVTIDEALTNSVIDSGPDGYYAKNHG